MRKRLFLVLVCLFAFGLGSMVFPQEKPQKPPGGPDSGPGTHHYQATPKLVIHEQANRKISGGPDKGPGPHKSARKKKHKKGDSKRRSRSNKNA